MGTIIDYLKEYGDCSFRDMPMNDVDSLVLCQLAYLKFDGIVPEVEEDEETALPEGARETVTPKGARGTAIPEEDEETVTPEEARETATPKEDRGMVTLEEVARHERVEALFSDVRYEKENRALFEAMLGGRRYRTLRLGYYVNVIEKEWETQFSAVTFLLEDGTLYIAFRGTDETIVGWKEDFNMAFQSPVPGQAYSVRYLNRVTDRFAGDFYVGGHSKGGNLAVYSAMNCSPKKQARIRRIYSMDGPGFRPEVLRECHYDRIEEKVFKIMPRSSLVGMLFEREIHYEVVESKNFGLAQHDPYSWKVEGRHFIKVRDIYESSRKMDDTLNEWILSLDETQLRTFVDTLFQVISASQAEDLIAFTADWKKSMNGVISALKEVDDETAKMLKQVIRSLFEIARLHVKEDVASGIASVENHVSLKKNGPDGKRGPRRPAGPKEALPTE